MRYFANHDKKGKKNTIYTFIYLHKILVEWCFRNVDSYSIYRIRQFFILILETTINKSTIIRQQWEWKSHNIATLRLIHATYL